MLARPYHKHTISKLHWDCTAILPYYNRMGTKTQSLRMLNSLCQEVHRPQLDKWWVRAAEVIATGKDREGSYPIKIPVVILLFQSVFSFCWVLLKWFRSRFEDPHGMRIICRSLKVSKHQILASYTHWPLRRYDTVNQEPKLQERLIRKGGRAMALFRGSVEVSSQKLLTIPETLLAQVKNILCMMLQATISAGSEGVMRFASLKVVCQDWTVASLSLPGISLPKTNHLYPFLIPAVSDLSDLLMYGSWMFRGTPNHFIQISGQKSSAKWWIGLVWFTDGLGGFANSHDLEGIPF